MNSNFTVSMDILLCVFCNQLYLFILFGIRLNLYDDLDILDAGCVNISADILTANTTIN